MEEHHQVPRDKQQRGGGRQMSYLAQSPTRKDGLRGLSNTVGVGEILTPYCEGNDQRHPAGVRAKGRIWLPRMQFGARENPTRDKIRHREK
ncbi:hypothetical protein SUGI_0189900 [Cryptomeria japonica]|nr:hypothetical protein SUGI_0189900 [Cryptomeria japonica]